MSKPSVVSESGRISEPPVVPLASDGVVALGLAGEGTDSSFTFDDYRRMRGAELLRGGFAPDEVGAMLQLPLEDVAGIRRCVARIPRVPRATGARRDPMSTGNLGQYGRSGRAPGGEW